MRSRLFAITHTNPTTANHSKHHNTGDITNDKNPTFTIWAFFTRGSHTIPSHRRVAGKAPKMLLSIKQLRKEMTPPDSDVTSLRQEMVIMQNNRNAIGYHLEASRGCSRFWFHSFVFHSPDSDFTPPDIHTELTQLANELSRTLQQFQILTETTYI